MKDKEMIYDLIIIGGGASGLFAGASLPKPLNGLILEKSRSPGIKLLMTGSGQCNMTHTGSIKDFISHYGENGNRIRPILYGYNNLRVMEFFKERGVPLLEREDGKVFPKSLKARDILSVLMKCCDDNGFGFQYSFPVTDITIEFNAYTVHCGNKKYEAKNLIVATGGCSYPATGSDGSIFPILAEKGIKVVTPKPGLVPICVENYPYKSLSGVSVPGAKITVGNGKKNVTNGDLLFTHNSFSGPAMLNISRYADPGARLCINYCPGISYEQLANTFTSATSGNRKQLSTLLYEILNESSIIPKRMIDLLCLRCNVNPSGISSAVSKAQLNAIIRLITEDCFIISGTGGYKSAMVTAGGISLDEIHIKTLESKKYPGIYFIGEVLDVDGDTGGYNLQFAFSSAHGAASNINV
jgi:predicted Rossmann fold flavoprotein